MRLAGQMSIGDDFVRCAVPIGETENAPPGPAGRGILRGSVAAATVGARPDQRVGLAALVLDQVRVDGIREAWIVELDREVRATLVGALRPGGAYLHSSHEDAVGWRVLVAARGFLDQADVLGLE